MTVMGTRVLRKEDPAFLTRGARYTADVRDPRLDRAVHATFVRSYVANGRIESVDVAGALEMPGVVAVITGADLPETMVLPGPVPLFPPPFLNRPMLARDRVRFVGEPVAVVLTEHPEQGEDAAEAVFVDIEALDPVVDVEAAAGDAVLVHEDVGTNVMVTMSQMGMASGLSDDAFFADCDVVVSERVVHNRVSAAPLETRSAATVWDDDGRLVMWISNQAAHTVKNDLATVYGLDAASVHVVVPDVGGGFGAKIYMLPEEALLPHLSRVAGRPVRWFETRTENLTAVGFGRAQIHHATLGGTAEGDLTHYRLDIIGETGAYGRIGGFLPFFTVSMAAGTYAIPHIETEARSVATNTVPSEAFRGAGRPEATLTIERMVDRFAAEAGLDPVAVRRRNLIPADAFPVTTAVGTEYDSGDYERSLDLALERAGYHELRAEQERRRVEGTPRQLGIGIACYVEVTAGPAPGGEEFARAEITPDGRARVYSGSLSHGQSHATTFAMIAADRLGMDPSDVEIVQGDTDLVAAGRGTMGSRSTQLGGSAVHVAADRVVEQAREVAADLLEAAVDDVVLDTDTGTFHVAGVPGVARTWADVAAAAEPGRLAVDEHFEAKCSYPFGTHLAVVEVDTDTGEVRLVRMVTVDDAGTLVNPMIVEGQRHGGIAQGVAQALMEEVRYDDDGNPITSNFADYGIISMAELPSFELVAMETPTPNNPLGAKGIGESGAIGGTPAVQNAVVDALAHLGVRHIDLPTTPERVWTAIREATA